MKETELTHIVIEFDNDHRCGMFVEKDTFEKFTHAIGKVERFHFNSNEWWFPITEIKEGESPVCRAGEYDVAVMLDKIRMYQSRERKVQK